VSVELVNVAEHQAPRRGAGVAWLPAYSTTAKTRHDDNRPSVRLSSLWNLLRDRSPRSGGGAGRCTDGVVSRPGLFDRLGGRPG
jgi:hypothetical protein